MTADMDLLATLFQVVEVARKLAYELVQGKVPKINKLNVTYMNTLLLCLYTNFLHKLSLTSLLISLFLIALPTRKHNVIFDEY